ncbi:MAG: hypothetical protein LBH93_01650 [Chitinispirillales bacterium]|jgi:hypothetical protein|nr:hypothetical protein [Chitinispirillales bacterium]
MSNELAIAITAVSGFASIVVTTVINYLFKRMDYKREVRKQTIDSLGNYYLPLVKHLKKLRNSLQNYMRADDESTIESLFSELARQRETRGTRIGAKGDVEGNVVELSEFMTENKTTYINDSILWNYYCLIDDFIVSLSEAVSKRVMPIPDQYNKFDVGNIDQFIKRIDIVRTTLF